MANRKKLTERLLRFPPSMREREIKVILSAHGWREVGGKDGSHRKWVKAGADDSIEYPVHHEQIAREYLRQIATTLGY